MLTFQINKIFPIKTECCNKYDGITYDGCFFYFTQAKCCKIYKYDRCFHQVDCVTVSREYTSISYDQHCKCFWAITDKTYNKIFKLDLCFKEIDYIAVKYTNIHPIRITGLSCDCDKCSLLISFDQCIATVRKSGNPEACVIKKASSAVRFESVQSSGDCYIAANTKGICESISVYADCNKLKLQCSLPDDYSVEDMTVVCGYNCCDESYATFYILISKGYCYSYLMKCSLCCTEECEDDCCDDFCCFHCMEHPNHSIDCKKGCADIIESIALVETSLSHILNAEGEKIQKVLSITNEPCEIIKVNNNVNKTIMNITHLEHILFAKLQLVNEICPKMCGEVPPCDD